jgi:hypothetical protein
MIVVIREPMADESQTKEGKKRTSVSASENNRHM